MRNFSESPVQGLFGHGHGHDHPPGVLLLMSCPVQGTVILRPTVVHKPDRCLCQVQELSISVRQDDQREYSEHLEMLDSVEHLCQIFQASNNRHLQRALQKTI